MRWSSASRCSPRSRRKSWLAKSRVRLAASTTVSIVSSRATSERLTPAASRKSKVAATGSGSEMPVELDEQVVEAAVGGEAAHLGQEVAAQGAADAAVGHLDQGFVAAQHLGPSERTRSASMFTSDMSLTMMAIRIPSRLRSAWLRSVVLPEPRKPDRTVTGSLVGMALTAAAGTRHGSR